MTLDEVCAVLNEYRVSAEWADGWRRRGVNHGEVLAFLRGLMAIARAAFRRGDMPAFDFHAELALRYAKNDWIEFEVPFGYMGPRGPLMGPRPIPEDDPADGTADEHKADWIKFVQRASGDQTYGQVIAFFHETHGYWPKRDWPGMPIYAMDRLNRIKHVKPGNIVPFQ